MIADNTRRLALLKIGSLVKTCGEIEGKIDKEVSEGISVTDETRDRTFEFKRLVRETVDFFEQAPLSKCGPEDLEQVTTLLELAIHTGTMVLRDIEALGQSGKQLRSMIKRIRQALAEGLLKEGEDSLFNKLDAFQTPLEAHRWVNDLIREAKNARRQARRAEQGNQAKAVPQPQPRVPVEKKELSRLEILEARAQSLVTPEACALREEAKQVCSNREKARLLKRALYLEEKGSEETEPETTLTKVVETPVDKPAQEPTISNRALREIVREALPCPAGWSECEWEMAREIIRVLAHFGRRGGFFNDSYLAKKLVKKIVRNQYIQVLKKPFDRTLFYLTAKHLEGMGVVSKDLHAKSGDDMISLSPHKNRVGEPARTIIEQIVTLKNSLNHAD